jgi:hypothetical protein
MNRYPIFSLLIEVDLGEYITKIIIIKSHVKNKISPLSFSPHLNNYYRSEFLISTNILISWRVNSGAQDCANYCSVSKEMHKRL